MNISIFTHLHILESKLADLKFIFFVNFVDMLKNIPLLVVKLLSV